MTATVCSELEVALSATEFAAAVAEHERQAAVLALQLRRLEASGDTCGHWRKDADAVINADAPPVEPDRALIMGRDGEGVLVRH